MSRVFAVILLLLALWPAAADEKVDWSQVEKVALDELKTTNTPGGAIAVTRGDRVLYAKGFGVASIETGAPVTPDMLFRLGSTTKMFTAAALVLLAEQGKLDLHAPIGRYLQGLHPKVAQVTGHQLLSHTSGILDEAPMFGLHDDSALRSVVRSWKETHFFTEPGSIFSYSNPGYWLAGFLIEVVGGKPFADQVAEGVLQPLGMTRSTFRPLVAMTYPLSQGHDGPPAGKGAPVVIRPIADNSASWPAGSLYSSASELARFAIAFLNDGMLDGQQVLAPAAMARLSTPRAGVPGQDSNYGYGLMLSRSRGVRWIEHGGSRLGTGSLLRMTPEHRVAVITVANRSGANLSRTSEKAVELLLPLEPRPAQKPPAAAPIAGAEMTQYAGLYANGAQSVELLVKDGKLVGKRGGGSETPVVRTDANRIRLGDQGMSYVTVRGPDGSIHYLHTGSRSLRRVN